MKRIALFSLGISVMIAACFQGGDGSAKDALGVSDLALDVEDGNVSGEGGTVEALVDLSLWEWLPEADDPFADHRPDGVVCEVGYGIEDTIFEVETDKCPYATFSQPLLQGVNPGDSIRFVIWHLDLWADESAQAHVAIQLGDLLVWEAFPEIPGVANIWDMTLEIDQSISSGSPAYFHLHNHGYNSWRFAKLERIEP